MSGKIVLITYTGEHAPGGVPRWVRDFKKGFPEAVSYSIEDLPGEYKFKPAAEWDIAKGLAFYLQSLKKVDKDDIIIVDGYWGRGWEHYPNVVSVCHGIWSHLIKEEADAGCKPDFPLNHAIQVDYRREHLKRGGRLVAVSEFIAHQMQIQWGFESKVINNAIDLDEFKPTKDNFPMAVPLIIHGVNDKGNKNKGWDHIQYLKENLGDVIDGQLYPYEILSLDEAYEKYGKKYNLTKYQVLSNADLVVIPSGYEGNSYFALETLALDVAVVAYDVGLFWELHKNKDYWSINKQGTRYELFGMSLPRSLRSKEETLFGVECVLNQFRDLNQFNSREVAKQYSIQNFHEQWRDYLKKEFGYESNNKS